MAQKIVQYQAVLQLAQGAPQLYDLPYLHRQMLEVLGIKNASKLVPLTDDEDRKPRDPVSENMDVINGKPVKAFIYQDHDAHIAAHTSFLQDPMIAQQMGQNPMAQQMSAAAQAHIAEHLAFLYRKKIEEQMGVPLPAPDEKLPEDIEVQLSRLVAQASAQLMQKNVQQAQQAQAQQQAQDPIVQMQQQELQIKMQDAQIKAQKVQGDLAIREQELQLKVQEAASRQGENPVLAAAKMQQEMEMDRQTHEQEMAQRQQEFDQKMAQKQREAAMNMQIKMVQDASKSTTNEGEK
jgi:hypothetical protein